VVVATSLPSLVDRVDQIVQEYIRRWRGSVRCEVRADDRSDALRLTISRGGRYYTVVLDGRILRSVRDPRVGMDYLLRSIDAAVDELLQDRERYRQEYLGRALGPADIRLPDGQIGPEELVGWMPNTAIIDERKLPKDTWKLAPPSHLIWFRNLSRAVSGGRALVVRQVLGNVGKAVEMAFEDGTTKRGALLDLDDLTGPAAEDQSDSAQRFALLELD
jgi:hypothetical protein